MIKTPVILDADRYWWILRDADGIKEICRIRKDGFDADETLKDVFLAITLFEEAQAMLEAVALSAVKGASND